MKKLSVAGSALVAITACSCSVTLVTFTLGGDASIDTMEGQPDFSGDASIDTMGGGQPDGRPSDAAMATPYKGTIAQTLLAAFGGTPYCNYTITLKQLEIDLEILSSGQVTTGRVQDLNVEGTDATCPDGPIPPTIANYTLTSATPASGGTMLAFQGAPGNAPTVSLSALLTPSGTAYTVILSFHRIDQSPPLDWSVIVTLPLAPQ
ncbi:MAG TPA: hypothetical protein VHN14_16645 [Kofleriaceae bacterium]|jgi:hypothetical protein|nr:hypothetical protein [Kofleriaceae bacterium]